MIYLTPKTNWNRLDTYLAEDLNRVENNTKYLAELLPHFNYTVPSMTHKLDWTNEDIIYNTDLNRIENNIKLICDSYFTNEVFETLKIDWNTLDPVTYELANRIEKDLKMVDTMITAMQKEFIHSNVANCGQSRTWQINYRPLKNWEQFKDFNFNDYPNTDTISMIATNSNKTLVNHTDELGLSIIDVKDDIYASIEDINNSMILLDDLIGGIE